MTIPRYPPYKKKITRPLEQTPIRKVIALLDKEVEYCIRQNTQAADLKVLIMTTFRKQLIPLLEEEKRFAKDAFEAGFDSKECTVIGNFGESFPSYTQDDTFDDYYKKYES